MIRCIKLRRHEKNTRRAFVDLELSRDGLVLRDCTYLDGKEWLGWPSKPYETKNGERSRQSIIEFAEGAKKARKQFQEGALTAINTALAEQERGRS